MNGAFKVRNIQRARALRVQSSPAERLLWKALSRRQLLGEHFTRQRQVGPYFLDFACRRLLLAIELDGHSHDMRQSSDLARDAYLRHEGWTVLRYRNEDVMGNLDGVLRDVALQIARLPSPSPSSLREGSNRDAPSRLREGSKSDAPSGSGEGRKSGDPSCLRGNGA